MSKWGYGSVSQTWGTVEDSAGTIIAANPARKYLHICNDSGSALWLSFGGSAEANKGFRLNGAGSVQCCLDMTLGAGNIYTGYITGIVGTGGSINPLVTEGE